MCLVSLWRAHQQIICELTARRTEQEAVSFFEQTVTLVNPLCLPSWRHLAPTYFLNGSSKVSRPISGSQPPASSPPIHKRTPSLNSRQSPPPTLGKRPSGAARAGSSTRSTMPTRRPALSRPELSTLLRLLARAAALRAFSSLIRQAAPHTELTPSLLGLVFTGFPNLERACSLLCAAGRRRSSPSLALQAFPIIACQFIHSIRVK